MFTVYSKENCPGCSIAIGLLQSKSLEHRVLKLGTDYTAEDLQKIVPGARTVPQIVNDDTLIGGLQELQKFLVDMR